MLKNLCPWLLVLAWLSCSDAMSIKSLTELKDTLYDYGYVDELENVYYKTGNFRSEITTTQRPITRYWNNLVRNVRFPWNITNPLANLFNDGNPNIIETPVLEAIDSQPSKKKRKSHRRHSNNRRTSYSSSYSAKPYRYSGSSNRPAKVVYVYAPPIRTQYWPANAQYQQGHQNDQYYEPSYGSQDYERNGYNHRGYYYFPGQNADHSTGRLQNDEFPSQTFSDEEESNEKQEAEENIATTNTLSNDDEDGNGTFEPSEGVELVDSFNEEDGNDADNESNVGDNDMQKQESSFKRNSFKNNKESLRSVIGSHMSEDSLIQKRQRNHSKIKKIVDKPSPRFKYFIIGDF